MRAMARSTRRRLALAAGALAAAAAAPGGRAHAFLKEPISRNYLAAREGSWGAGSGIDRGAHAGELTYARESCPHCLNKQVEDGFCGRTQPGVPYGEYTFPKNVYGDEMPAPPVVAEYLEGEEIAVGFSVTTHHYGHVEARVCCDFRPGEDTNGTQACFDAGELAFVRDELYDAPPDPAYPGRGHLAPLEFSEGGHAAGNNYRNDGSEDLGGMPFHHTFRLPSGVHGDRCVLQWIYVTSQNCESPGYEAYEWPSGSWRQRGADHFRCPDPPSRDGSGYPERFWNCADVKIAPADPGVLAAKRLLEPVVDALEVGAAFFEFANRTCAGPELDTADASGNTCRSFKDWGKCDEAWIVDGGFCERTCGRCRDPTDPDDPLYNLTRVQTTSAAASGGGGAAAAAGWGDILGRR